MRAHLLRIAGIAAAALLAVFYPFLPGQYDPAAVPVSTAVQLYGAAGLLLLPLAGFWLGAEIRAGARRRRGRTPPPAARRYAIMTFAAGSLLVLLVSLAVFFGISRAVGIVALILGSPVAALLMRRIGQRGAGPHVGGLPPAPLYLIAIPLLVTTIPIAVAGPITSAARDRAMARSAELLEQLERHHAAYGRYPPSLVAVWKDFSPGVVGIEQYRYAPNGPGYDLVFEQPRLLFDNLGTREFVVYNRWNRHRIPSHAAWILAWSEEVLATRQGWYAAHTTSRPHWNYFWFD